MLTIKRTRYVVINSRNEIFCGLARHYTFKPIDDLGDTAIKTYLSEKKAKSSFLSSWYGSKEEDFKDGTFRVVRVIESLTESEESNNG